MTYTRPTSSDAGTGGGPTDLTVILDALADGLEAVEAALPGKASTGHDHAGTYEPAGAAASAVAAHEADTTSVHGIADTSALVVTSDARLSDARTPTGSASGDLTGTYPGPSIAARAVSWGKVVAVSATSRLLGRKTAGSGDVEELTGSDVAAILPDAAASVKGLVTPPGGTTTFLRADATWAAPAGGSGYSTVADEGSALTGRTTLDFVGDDVTAMDDGASTRVRPGRWAGAMFQKWGTASTNPLSGLTATEILGHGNPGSFLLGSTGGFAAPLPLRGPKPRYVIPTTSRTSAGTMKTLTTAWDHGLVAGDVVAIAGSGGTGYNVEPVTISSVTANTITYTGTASSTETGVANTSGRIFCAYRAAQVDVTSRTSTGTTRTLTTGRAHTLGVGQAVRIAGVSADYNGDFVVASVPSTTTFTYTASGSLSEGATGTTGTVDLGWWPVGSDRHGGNAILNSPNGRMAIPVYDAAASLSASPGWVIAIGTSMPSSLATSGLSYSSPTWVPASTAVCYALFESNAAESPVSAASARVHTLPTEAAGLLVLGNLNGVTGPVASVDKDGRLQVRGLYTGTVYEQTATGAVVAGDVVMYQRVGRRLEASVYTYAASGLTHKSTLVSGFMGATNIDGYNTLSAVGFGYSGTTVGRWYAAVDGNGAGMVKLGG